MENIYLIGLMGSGKSAIGKALCHKIHRKYVDTDAVVEKNFNMTIAEIFQNYGEKTFRQAEKDVMMDLARRRNRVVSTGGGVILQKENVKLMRKSGVVIWLERDIELILKGKRIRQRPLLAENPGKIYDIAKERYDIYETACHFKVDNNGTPGETVGKILAVLKNR